MEKRNILVQSRPVRSEGNSQFGNAAPRARATHILTFAASIFVWSAARESMTKSGATMIQPLCFPCQGGLRQHTHT